MTVQPESVQNNLPRKLPSTSMVKQNLLKAKSHLDNFNKVIQVRTKVTWQNKGTWGFEHIRGAFKKDVIPFVKFLRESFANFKLGLYREVYEMKAIFQQMETEVEQCSVDRKYFEIEKKELLIENDHLSEQIISQDIVCIAMHSYDDLVKYADMEKNMCIVDYLNDVNKRARAKSIKSIKKNEWTPTGRVFTNVGHKWLPIGRIFTIDRTKCPLIRTTSTKIVPPRSPVQTKVITKTPPSRVSQWKPNETKTMCSSSKPRIVESRSSDDSLLHPEPLPNSNKTLYELIHDKKSYLKYPHVFGALCYPTNDSEDLGKMKPKADIDVFIGYSPAKKAYRIYNKRTRLIMETIHVKFDELTTTTSEQFSSGLAPQLLTSGQISSRLVQTQFL
ncbi:retrovirus-related pol polyprotein from transposon TNT 1-94 [Tanacetum coccineum]